MNTQLNPKPNLVASEWIDRYVNEVGRRLPAKQRSDVEREIRSLIEDEVLARLDSQATAGEPPLSMDETVLAVLQQFGAPEQLVAHYTAPHYLIGPALFPIFRVVVTVVLVVALFGSIIGLAVASGSGSIPPFFDALADIWGGLLQTFATIVLVFAIIEYFTRGATNKVAQAEKAWNPRTLPAIKDVDRAGVFEPALDIGFDAAALVLFNFYFNQVAFYNQVDGQWQSFPIFSPEFAQFIPWLSAVWVLDILVNAAVLVRGRWQPWLRVAGIGVSLFGAAVLVSMLGAGQLAAWAPVDPAFRVTVAVILAFTLFDIGQHAWRLFNGQRWTSTGPTAHLTIHS